MYTTIIALVGLAAIQASAAQPQAGFKLVPIPPRIEVTGYGQVKTMPGMATIGYTARGEGATSDDAVRAMTASAARIDAALHTIDSAAEPHTSEVRIAAVRSDDCKEQSYGRPQLSTGACAISGYVATQSVTVRTTAVKEVGTMVGLAGRSGALNPQINSFDQGDSRAVQQQAIAAALADAQSKAAVIAAESHVRLGAILNITSGPRNDRQELPIVSGTRISVNAPPPPAPPPVPVKVVPEPLTTNSYVTIVYGIVE